MNTIDYNEVNLLDTSIYHDILNNKLTENQQIMVTQQMNENQLKVAIALLRSYSLDELLVQEKHHGRAGNEESNTTDQIFQPLLNIIKSAMLNTS